MDDSKQGALNAYWAAKTPDQEREAFARMAALGMLNDGSLTTILPPPTDDLSTIPVTPEMIAAGYAMDQSMRSPLPDEAPYFTAVYRAMAALAPVELVSAGELAALRERDEARAILGRSKLQTEKWKRDFLSARDVLNANEKEITALRAELMAARGTIARFTATNVPDPLKPDPIANATRARETDRRRMGL